MQNDSKWINYEEQQKLQVKKNVKFLGKVFKIR